MATKYVTLAAGGLAYALSYDDGVVAGTPTAPAQYSVPSYSLPVGGTTYECNISSDFTTALASAVAGDVIVLKAGFTYQGNYTLPTTDGSGWLYIVSDSVASLPESGTRVVAADATNMPLIQAPNYNNPALTILGGSQKVRIVGCEIGTAHTGTVNTQYGLVRLGYGGTGNADNIVLDRCYVHGTDGANVRDGVVLYNVTNYSIQDCRIAKIHYTGDESHGIHVYLPEGPGLIDNNYVEAAGENIFIGDNTVTNVPKDITITNNHCYKPWEWWASHPTFDGSNWSVKNLIEWKACQRCLCEGNVFENCWLDAQIGVAVLFTARGGANEDITFRYNYLLNVESGWNVNSADVSNTRILIEHNLLFTGDTYSDIDQPGYFVRIAATPGNQDYVTIRHNTIVGAKDGDDYHSGAVYFEGSDDATDHITFQDNMCTHGTYGVFGSGGTEDAAAFAKFCVTYTFDSNAQITTLAAGGFTDTTFDNLADFALTAESTYHNAASDGTDVGCDISALAAAIAGVV